MVHTTTIRTTEASSTPYYVIEFQAKKYHRPSLYIRVAQYRPFSSGMWDVVSNHFHAKTGELKVRDNVERYFVQKCYNLPRTLLPINVKIGGDLF